MFNTTTLMWGMLFGLIGYGFFSYGKKQGAIMPLISGIALMVFPYFVTNTYLMLAVGVILMSLPYFIRL
jgi:hypothetical protein